MTVRQGFYRHYKGHLYYVVGITCLKHEGDRRIVSCTSVRTEESSENFDYLGRDEQDFEAWVDPATGDLIPSTNKVFSSELRAKGYCQRFERVMDPEKSITPR